MSIKPAAAQDAALTEAVEAAFQQLEPNRVACAASWPLRVMVRCGHAGVRRLVGRLLDVLAKEEHGLRQLDSLAAVIGPLLAIPELRALAWPSFLAAADASTGWRTERIVSWKAAALAEYDKPAALRLLAGRSPYRFASKASAAIAAMTSPPRE